MTLLPLALVSLSLSFSLSVYYSHIIHYANTNNGRHVKLNEDNLLYCNARSPPPSPVRSTPLTIIRSAIDARGQLVAVHRSPRAWWGTDARFHISVRLKSPFVVAEHSTHLDRSDSRFTASLRTGQRQAMCTDAYVNISIDHQFSSKIDRMATVNIAYRHNLNYRWVSMTDDR